MTIILDSGHGSETVSLGSKCSPDKTFWEYIWNHDTTQLLYTQLQEQGIDVVWINPTTEPMSLDQRCKKINDICRKNGTKNCILISVHVNAASNGKWSTARGWSVWVSKNASVRSKEIANKFYDGVDKHFNCRKPAPTQKYWEANFQILNNTLCPAVLLENFFMDNKDDLILLRDPKVQETLVKSFVETIKTL